ncbi:MAG: AN1-type zinc finger domain-containing protein [Candidatus Baldrarchaeia archaeon]
MPYCQYCGKEIVLPFVCKYCGGIFCEDHRLPEAHDCPYMPRVKEWVIRPTVYVPVPPPPPAPAPQIVEVKKARFSSTEIMHLFIGCILILLVGFSLFMDPRFIFGVEPFMAFLLALSFIPAFLFHELAHKFVAQRYGCWAEFRLIEWGLILTLLSILPYSPLKIIAPGAVMIAGGYDRDVVGKIALAGPCINLALALISLPLYFIFATNPIIAGLMRFNIYLNSFLGLFNMLPLGILDGKKVFDWRPDIGIITLAALAALFGISIMYLL